MLFVISEESLGVEDHIPARVICAKCGKPAMIVYDPPDPEVGITNGAYWTECCQVYYDECEAVE